MARFQSPFTSIARKQAASADKKRNLHSRAATKKTIETYHRFQVVKTYIPSNENITPIKSTRKIGSHCITAGIVRKTAPKRAPVNSEPVQCHRRRAIVSAQATPESAIRRRAGVKLSPNSLIGSAIR